MQIVEDYTSNDIKLHPIKKADSILQSAEDHALMLRTIGFSVFPLKNPEHRTDGNLGKERDKDEGVRERKIPDVDSLDDFKKAPVDEDKIRLWFQENPNRNNGVFCGQVSNNLIVVDVDGEKAKARLEEEVLQKSNSGLKSAFMNTMIVTTGSGGRHYYFLLNDPIIEKMGSSKLWSISGEKHTEISIFGNGHYVVGPGSRHPNGEYYKWNGKRSIPISRKELEEFIKLVSNDINARIPVIRSRLGNIDSEGANNGIDDNGNTLLLDSNGGERRRNINNNDNPNQNIKTLTNAIPISANTTASNEVLQEIYKLLKPYYQWPDRDEIIFCLSGMMRKDGNFSLEECKAVVTMLYNNSGYSDENLPKSLDVVERTYATQINQVDNLKGRSGLNHIIVSKAITDDKKITADQLRARQEAMSKLLEIILENASKTKGETLLDGCIIMEPIHHESHSYMTVYSKDNYEDKQTKSVRPIRAIRSLNIVKREDKDGNLITRYEFGQDILKAMPVPPITRIYDPLFKLWKYDVMFEYVGSGNTPKTLITGPMTKEELIDFVKDKNLVANDKALVNAMNLVLLGYERKDMIVDRTETETEGLIWNPETNRLYLSKRTTYKPTPEECRAAIDITERTQSRFYMNFLPERPIERKRYAHFLKIGLVSVVDFARRQCGAAAPNRGKFIPRQDLAGVGNAGKSYGYAGLALRLYRLPVDGSSPYIISASSVETEARFIEQTKWTTFPVIFDDIDWLSNWEKDKRAIAIGPLLKNQVERTNPRDIQNTENKKRHLPSCAYIMLTHNSDLIDEDGFVRRSTGHEFIASDAKTIEEIKGYNDWYNEHAHTFGYLGDFAISYYLENPNVLFKPWLDIAKEILRAFYKYAGIESGAPEWLLNEVVDSATSQEALFESRKVTIINTLHDVLLNHTWSRNKREIALWIIKNLRTNSIGQKYDELTPEAKDMVDEVTISATIEEKIQAIARLNLVPYVKWHEKKQMICIGAEFVKELKKKDLDRISMKQIESYCPQLRYDEHIRLGDGYSTKQKMLTIKLDGFAKMLNYTDGDGIQTTFFENGGDPK